jgi:spore germination cell wall hydrolase CwlJ-like protein
MNHYTYSHYRWREKTVEITFKRISVIACYLAASLAFLTVSDMPRAEDTTEPETVIEVFEDAIPPKKSFYDQIDKLAYRWLYKRDKQYWTETEKECLARNIYHEAANEPVEGQVAVAIVTLNRANDPFYPNNICQVVYQRGTVVKTDTIQVKIKKRYEERLVQKNYIVCQFSWTCERVKPPSENSVKYQQIKEIVDEFADGGYSEWREKYAKSLHYHAYYVNPRWKLNRLARVGAHIFYD